VHRFPADPPSRLPSAPTIRRARTRARFSLGGLIGAALAGCVLIAASPLGAQDAPPPPPGAPPPPPPGVSAARAPLYSAPQLEQMVAPIALYPDDLLGQILMAATYPLEVVQADRWLQDPNNAALQRDVLEQALQSQPWDPSVKSLVAYPQVLSMMDDGLEWTEALGDAFLAQQADVMDAVQRLRARARAAGTLTPTPQQQVLTQDGAIEIAPAPDQGVEYVPVYDPQSAYGPWPYPDYPPEELYVPGYAFGTFITFPIVYGYWGWDHWDWRHHRIDIDGGVGTPGWTARAHGPLTGGGPARRPAPVAWHHDPEHRGGVPYRDPVTRERFVGTPDIHSVRSGFRGYTVTQRAAAPAGREAPRPMERPASPPPAPRPALIERPAPVERQAPVPRAQGPRYEVRPAPAPERPMAPAFESFGRGAEVHVQEQRGMASRVAPPGGGGGRPAGGHR
jgi:hypothetical protein